MVWIAFFILIAAMTAVVFLMLRISAQMNQQLNSMSQQVNERLKETSAALMDTHKSVGQRLDSATAVFGDVQKSLGKLEEAQQRIYTIGKDISGLQDLLRAPKFRGQMGEMLLENLLSQVLPKDYYQMQYRFKTSDVVDAVIKLGERLVPVDAKFSLENFRKMLEVSSPEEQAAFRKKFIQDVKLRVEEIAKKYILPGENTYDFALMYIPAENVYYEVIIKEDFLSYSISKKVIPVSPNTFYAYLQIICLGLRGLKVEENAKQILKSLGMLSVEMGKFREDFDILGNHLSNARNKYEESQKRLDRFSDKLQSTQDERRQLE